MTTKSYAKINLTLDILRTREDGYHDLSSVMHTISLYDVLSFEVTDNGTNENIIDISATNTSLPCDEHNLCHKACVSFLERFGFTGKTVKIHIEKNIPMAAGLGGGSSDCASTLLALDKLLNVNAGKEIDVLAKNLGADVPFFLYGGCRLAEGIGEKLTELEPIKNTYVLLAKPDEELCTHSIYKDFDCMQINESDKISKPSTKEFVENIKSESRWKYVANMLGAAAEKRCKGSAEIREYISMLGAYAACVTGSGPTVYGIFDSKEKAEAAKKAVKAKFSLAFCEIYETV